jgi:hypothetical protein
MFEKTTRLKLRFDSPKGQLSVEELWDLPLTARNGGASLDNIARAASRTLKETAEESFVVKTAKSDAILQLRFDVVKHIIDVKIAEAEATAAAADKREKKQKLLALIADKQDEQLKGTSLEDLQKMVDAL